MGHECLLSRVEQREKKLLGPTFQYRLPAALRLRYAGLPLCLYRTNVTPPECIRPSCPQTTEEAEKRVLDYVQHYNEVRLHSAIDDVTPADKLHGKAKTIVEERDRKLEAAREKRRLKRSENRQVETLAS